MSKKELKMEDDHCFGEMYDENEVECQACIDAESCKSKFLSPKKEKKIESKKLEAKPKKEKKAKEKLVLNNVLSPPLVITNKELKELHGMFLTHSDEVEEKVKKEKRVKNGTTLVGNRKRTISAYMDYLGLTGKYTLDEMVSKLSIYNKIKNTKGDLKRRLVNHFRFIETNRPSVDRVDIDNGVYRIVLK